MNTKILRPIKKKFLNRRRQEILTAFVCLSPVLLYAAVFLVFPIAFSILLSFMRWRMVGPKYFVGWANYQEILTDHIFFKALGNTFYYTVIYVPLSIIVALLTAMLLNSKIKGRSLYRTAVFTPVVTSIVAVAIVWRYLFNTQYGLLNEWLGWFGLGPVGWLTDERWAMFSVIIFNIWKGLGGNVVLYLAALQGVPRHLYEAARIDGANSWHLFKNITWPLITPTTFFLFVMGFIGSIQVFEPVYVLTGGGPFKSTYVLFQYMYQRAFSDWHLGIASAVGYLMAVIIIIITIFNFLVSQRFVNYDL